MGASNEDGERRAAAADGKRMSGCDFEDADAAVLGTEDITIEGANLLQVDAGTGLISPARDLLADEIMSGTVLGSSPMSPLRHLSPSKGAALLGTPSKDQATMWAHLSPLRQGLVQSPLPPSYGQSPMRAHFIQSPMQQGYSQLLVESPARNRVETPDLLRASPELSPDGLHVLFISPQRPSHAANYLTDSVDWHSSSPIKTADPPEKRRSYKRRLQVSDFLAASEDVSRPRNPLERDLKMDIKVDHASGASSSFDTDKENGPLGTGKKRPREEATMGKGTPANLRSQPLSVLPSKTEERSSKVASAAPPDPERMCKCKKSACLKLYCDCFAAGDSCGPKCKCANCKNTVDNKAEVEEAVRLVLERNPKAFDPKIQSSETVFAAEDGTVMSVETHNRGCKCRKSNCQKKYCECLKGGVLCSSKCSCQGCQNCTPSSGGGGLTATKLGTGLRVDDVGSSPRPKLARRLNFENIGDGSLAGSKTTIDLGVGASEMKTKFGFMSCNTGAPGPTTPSYERPPVPIFREPA